MLWVRLPKLNLFAIRRPHKIAVTLLLQTLWDHFPKSNSFAKGPITSASLKNTSTEAIRPHTNKLLFLDIPLKTTNIQQQSIHKLSKR